MSSRLADRSPECSAAAAWRSRNRLWRAWIAAGPVSAAALAMASLSRSSLARVVNAVMIISRISSWSGRGTRAKWLPWAEAGGEVAQGGEGLGVAVVDEVDAAGGPDPDRVEVLEVVADHGAEPVGGQVGAVPLVGVLDAGQHGADLVLFGWRQRADRCVVGDQAQLPGAVAGAGAGVAGEDAFG